jgi:hypothetical protein
MKLYLEIDDKLMLGFKRMVLDEHGSLRGHLRAAVEDALREYLTKRGRQGNFSA